MAVELSDRLNAYEDVLLGVMRALVEARAEVFALRRELAASTGPPEEPEEPEEPE